ncbi:TPA: META domain-containing protein, partial [Aeromonas veronii]
MPRLPFLLIPLLLLAGCSSTAFVQQDLQHHHWVLSK